MNIAVNQQLFQSPPAGAPVASRWPRFEEEDVAAVVQVLRSGRVNALHHGEHCRGLEAEFAALVGLPFGIALANGTVALELALRAFGIGPGDEVIVTPRSFIASAACVVTVGATPVFADIDPITQGLSPASVAAAITSRTRAVIPVHLAGMPCDIEGLVAVAGQHGLKVIEDCAQAHGASIGGRLVGSFGDAAAFSFCTDKIISTGGEGGLLLLRDAEAHALAWSLKDHGKTFGPMPTPGIAFKWLHERCGTNLRMTEMQAAIGRAQLARLPRMLAVRRANAGLLGEALSGLPALRLPDIPPAVEPAWYRFTAFVRPERLKEGWSRNAILAAARAEGVPAQVGSCPEIYLERAFDGTGPYAQAPLPVARELGETSIVLPVDQTLEPEEVEWIGRTLAAVVRDASR